MVSSCRWRRGIPLHYQRGNGSPTRGRILRETAGTLVSPGLIEQLAGIEHLAPAVVTRARNVVHAIRREIPKGDHDAAFSHVIGGILKAQGHPDPAKANLQVVQPGLYDIAYFNTAADLPGIAANLRKNPSARLCLYGPPGTGKTSFGHWLAHEIGQPLHLQKASDLLSSYVGVTEQKIARTFERATQDGAVLLIDEVDSFLRDRTQTRHSWEVTQINEMLTQIESFPGILIASTNLITQLDPASMRRFDIKLHFGYLLPEQAGRLLVSYCRNLGLPQPTPADLRLATTLATSAPGDFAAIARQHRFQPFRNAHSLLMAVIAESELKVQSTRQIGFQYFNFIPPCQAPTVKPPLPASGNCCATTFPTARPAKARSSSATYLRPPATRSASAPSSAP